jgi:uncharacterized membrane protein YesL
MEFAAECQYSSGIIRCAGRFGKRKLLAPAVRKSLQIWWNHLVQLTLLHFLWLIAQLLIVTAPPATAALYVLVEKVGHGDLISPHDVWTTFRAMIVPAWKWAACNLAVLAVLAAWVLWSRGQAGVIATAASFLVLVALAFWGALNIFYWPLWLSQSDLSLRNTYRNAVVLVLTFPALSAALLLISLALVVVSALTLLPLIHVLMLWIALLGQQTTSAMVERLAARSQPAA